MAIYNAITGLKRKLPKVCLPRKKRHSHASTVASRMYSAQAMEAFEIYTLGARLCLVTLMIMLQFQGQQVANEMVQRMMLANTVHQLNCSVRMLILDSELMDMHLTDEEILETGYYKPLKNIRLDTYANDDECKSKTRFTKGEIRQILSFLNMGPVIKLYYNPNKLH